MTESIKDKISKLLALAERAGTPAEAEAASKMAERLMVKWGIEAAELQAAGEVKAEEIIEVKRAYGGSYGIAMIDFGHMVCRGLGNLKTLQSKSWDGKTRQLYVIGHKSDVERAEMLLTSLELQAHSAMKKWWKNAPERGYLTPMEGYKARRQFLVSFASEVGRRLREMRTEEVQATGHGASTELVLIDRSKKVDNWVNDKYKLGKARGGMQGSWAGSSEGRAAGRSANIGGNSIGGSGGALRA